MLKLVLMPMLLISAAFAQEINQTSIFFEMGKRILDKNQMEMLDLLVATINVKDKIKIIGYADFVGSDQYNLKLSADRAENVKQYLNLKNNQITFCQGKGAQKKSEDADEVYGIQAHRKVDIIIERHLDSAESIITAQPVKLTADYTNKELYEMVKEGETLVWQNLNFVGGRQVLLQESIPALEKLLSMLQENPTMRIRIEGHLCCERNLDDGLDIDTREQTLSLNRAKHVYGYLVLKGISPDRLSYIGFGGKRPLVDFELTEQDRITNRRVEIKVIAK
jgi:outer membrane protein OmpA-like peptidoglycan-associated protein